MSDYTFRCVIPFTPTPQPRHRTACRGRHAVIYEPKEAKVSKDAIKKYIIAQGIKKADKDVPVSVRLKLYYKRPKSHFGKKGLKPSAPKWHVQKPDNDNVEKLTWDALIGTAYYDDSHIVSNSTDKFWAEDGPSIEIEITWLE